MAGCALSRTAPLRGRGVPIIGPWAGGWACRKSQWARSALSRPARAAEGRARGAAPAPGDAAGPAPFAAAMAQWVRAGPGPGPGAGRTSAWPPPGMCGSAGTVSRWCESRGYPRSRERPHRPLAARAGGGSLSSLSALPRGFLPNAAFRRVDEGEAGVSVRSALRVCPGGWGGSGRAWRGRGVTGWGADEENEPRCWETLRISGSNQFWSYDCEAGNLFLNRNINSLGFSVCHPHSGLGRQQNSPFLTPNLRQFVLQKQKNPGVVSVQTWCCSSASVQCGAVTELDLSVTEPLALLPASQCDVLRIWFFLLI